MFFLNIRRNLHPSAYQSVNLTVDNVDLNVHLNDYLYVYLNIHITSYLNVHQNAGIIYLFKQLNQNPMLVNLSLSMLSPSLFDLFFQLLVY